MTVVDGMIGQSYTARVATEVRAGMRKSVSSNGRTSQEYRKVQAVDQVDAVHGSEVFGLHSSPIGLINAAIACISDRAFNSLLCGACCCGAAELLQN